ncbi:UDP-N-acetylglucosamine transferase subunit [Parahypoxylon ruwenzoriense]
METNRDRVLTHAFSNPIGDFLRGMIGVFCALAYTLFQLLLGIGTLLYLFPFYSMVLGLIILFIIRHFVLVSGRVDPKKLRAGWKSTRAPHYVLIVCGSGGHTGEMIRMVERSIRPTANSHRRWAIGHDDRLSFEKVLEFERRLGQTLPNVGTFDILYFRRGRAIHQSWLTTPFTALNSLIHVILVLVSPPGRRNAPEFCFPGVVVSDGPGTGFLVFLAAHLLKLFFVVPEEYMKTVFVESWARVNSLSLSGWLIHMFALADVFIVQHRRLAKRYGVSYTGNMVGMPTSPNVPMH